MEWNRPLSRLKCWMTCIAVSVSFLSAQTPQSPEAFLGRPLGQTFTPHHRVVDYVEHIAATAPHAKRITYGQTPEGRPLEVLVFSAPEHLARLDDLLDAHNDPNREDEVAVVWLSYDVHGNEAVCTEAALATIGHLALLKGESSIWLDDMIVLIDPCLNPDGHERYVNFYRQHAGSTPDASPYAVEHNEPWPGGRLNHYNFDLNRDWAWLVQPESKARWALYRQFMPHVHGDFHEMGYNSPYYFPPAVEPYHEVITDWQRAFQWEIGSATASNFDDRGKTYYTDEDFDLFYPSYGDTYPLYHGAIGMTYEQGGSGAAGLAVRTASGDTLTLGDRLENHLASSLVLMETAHRLREQLKQEYREWQRRNLTGEGLPYAGYLIPSGQTDRSPAVRTFLATHGIAVETVTASRSLPGWDYTQGKLTTFEPNPGDLWVPAAGEHARFLQVLMDPKPRLSDSLTYDIMAWALPYAHGLQAYACLDAPDRTSPRATGQDRPVLAPLPVDAYGWMVPLKGPALGPFLADAFRSGLTPRMAERDMAWRELKCPKGTPVFIRADQNTLGAAWVQTFAALCERHNVQPEEVPGGMTSEGPDLGSAYVRTLSRPAIGCLSGESTSATAMGAAWFHVEHTLGLPLRRLDFDNLRSAALEELDVLIMPGGWYDEAGLDIISDWVRNGGWLVTSGSGLRAWARHTAAPGSVAPSATGGGPIAYADEERERARRRVEGAVWKTERDDTHPLTWATEGPLFTLQNGSRRSERTFGSGTACVWIPSGTEPLSGFAGEQLRKAPEDLWVAGAWSSGAGGVVGFANDPLFRGFWASGQTLFNQALLIQPAFQ